MDSKSKPKVLKSLIKSLGPIPSAEVAIDGSTKCLVFVSLIAVLDLKLGFQADNSSITKSCFNAER